MYKIASHGTKSYGIKSFVLDTTEDVNSLPTNVEMGSSAYVIATGDKYLLNSEKQWIKQPKSAGGSGGGEDDIIILNGNTPSDNDDEILIL